MSINSEDIKKLANLAKLELNEPGFNEKLINDLNNILNLFNQLQNCSTEGIEPMYHSDDNAKQLLREDVVTAGNEREIMQQLAPANSTESGLYLVPKVLAE